MAILKEYRCMAHGPFEAFSSMCPRGCSARMVVREFRTAPNFQQKKTRVVDQHLRGIAKDFGLTDLKNDPKSGTSVMQELRKGRTDKSDWLQLDHAKPGFSREKDAQAPVFRPEASGFQPTPGAQAMLKSLPQPRARVVGRYDGK